MDLIIYLAGSAENRQRIEGLIERSFPRGKKEFFISLADLSQRLRFATYSDSIVLLAPNSKEGLQQLLSEREILFTLRTVVIAPAHDAETIAIAHQLRPRYLTYLDSELGDLAAVLQKMVLGHP